MRDLQRGARAQIVDRETRTDSVRRVHSRDRTAHVDIRRAQRPIYGRIRREKVRSARQVGHGQPISQKFSSTRHVPGHGQWIGRSRPDADIAGRCERFK